MPNNEDSITPQVRTILQTYASKPGLHGNVFIRAVIRDQQIKIKAGQ
jgi:hypothetical protein